MITIGITCYNEGDWLLECWESVLAQTDERWQAVLVMDKTTHARTQEIFQGLSHEKLKKHALQEWGGHSGVKNKAFQVTETPYHFYLDADDKLPTNAVESVLKTLAKNEGVDIIYGDYQLFAESTEVWKVPEKLKPEDLISSNRPTGASVYHKSLWERVGGFGDGGVLDHGMADLDFWIGAIEQGAVAKHCEAIFYHRRAHEQGQMSKTYNDLVVQKSEMIVERHPKFFADLNLKNKFLGEAYKTSASYYFFHQRDYQEALALAKKAMDYDMLEVYQRFSKNWRYKVPSWVVSIGDRLLDWKRSR